MNEGPVGRDGEVEPASARREDDEVAGRDVAGLVAREAARSQLLREHLLADGPESPRHPLGRQRERRSGEPSAVEP